MAKSEIGYQNAIASARPDAPPLREKCLLAIAALLCLLALALPILMWDASSPILTEEPSFVGP